MAAIDGALVASTLSCEMSPVARLVLQATLSEQRSNLAIGRRFRLPEAAFAGSISSLDFDEGCTPSPLISSLDSSRLVLPSAACPAPAGDVRSPVSATGHKVPSRKKQTPALLYPTSAESSQANDQTLRLDRAQSLLQQPLRCPRCDYLYRGLIAQ